MLRTKKSIISWIQGLRKKKKEGFKAEPIGVLGWSGI